MFDRWPTLCFFFAQTRMWAASESWTRDLILTKDALYHWAKAAKSERRDSNPRPPAWKASALSTELLSRREQHCRVVVWVRMDSNHRSRKTADLQSAPFGHSGTHPFFKDLSWASSRTRTNDRWITNLVLYQLSYRGKSINDLTIYDLRFCSTERRLCNPSERKSMQKYCFFLTWPNIFAKKCNFQSFFLFLRPEYLIFCLSLPLDASPYIHAWSAQKSCVYTPASYSETHDPITPESFVYLLRYPASSSQTYDATHAASASSTYSLLPYACARYYIRCSSSSAQPRRTWIAWRKKSAGRW